MSAAAIAVGAGLSYISGQQNAAAQRSANNANVALTKEQIAEDSRQFDVSQLEDERRYGLEYGRDEGRYQDQFGAGGLSQSKRDYAGNLLGEFNTTGQAASKEQAALLGLGTPEEQAAAMKNFGDSPGQKFMRDRAEKSLLRNSAKLGGLGGGNVRSELVEQGVGFAAQDYDNQFNRLGSLSNRGAQVGQSMTAQDLGVLPGGGSIQDGNLGQGDYQAGGPGGQPGVPNLSMSGRVNRGGAQEGTLTRQNRIAAEKAAADAAAEKAKPTAPVFDEQAFGRMQKLAAQKRRQSQGKG